MEVVVPYCNKDKELILLYNNLVLLIYIIRMVICQYSVSVNNNSLLSQIA